MNTRKEATHMLSQKMYVYGTKFSRCIISADCPCIYKLMLTKHFPYITQANRNVWFHETFMTANYAHIIHLDNLVS